MIIQYALQVNHQRLARRRQELIALALVDWPTNRLKALRTLDIVVE
ncbi:MAG: hypothetical protein IPJ48_06965 [Propionivibrio sp.]|uniref:Uncharacterized protein n=1 Tax=Candidatus Propionivibrio dominans TaxID=2954373 RepID=A0A9D7FEH8_9RHOO|nr:hypothetical protein [Candidatus Propionivibrio dominans]